MMPSHLRIFLLSCILCTAHAKYKPTWESIDSRPLPSWFDESKIGIFLHWGVYSVPGLGEWFLERWTIKKSWKSFEVTHSYVTGGDQEAVDYMKRNYPPDFTYDDFASEFKADLFSAREWANIFLKSGAKLVSTYQPEIIWSDGDWEANATYFSSLSFLSWLYNESPVRETVVTNDRWGQGTSCKHGGYYSCQDRYNPGILQPHKWENAMTLDKGSWGFRRNASYRDYINIETLLKTLAETLSCGGNLLVNIGPTSYGKIPPIGEEKLEQMGEWLKINGEGVYGSSPWIYQNDTTNSDVWYTMKKEANDCPVYAYILKWPQDGIISLGSPFATNETTVQLLGFEEELKFDFSAGKQGIYVAFPNIGSVGKWAWMLKLTHLQNGCHSGEPLSSEHQVVVHLI
ncbi:hypothetical protein J437_LFUL012072 [Ladona fulva]|uniref:alpha-L-fucosidase n=1 Tax=Ladona fulva TaxID=123851 RepID=A0A8K0KDN9_LADFU|nr:hypothetical protein J437_LFUL012072 [Ladona fulva]